MRILYFYFVYTLYVLVLKCKLNMHSLFKYVNSVHFVVRLCKLECLIGFYGISFQSIMDQTYSIGKH